MLKNTSIIFAVALGFAATCLTWDTAYRKGAADARDALTDYYTRQVPASLSDRGGRGEPALAGVDDTEATP